jgi:transposase
MGKAYSEDLRLKALSALDAGMKKMAVHQAFGIARSTLDDWIALREQQGHVAPSRPVGRTGKGFFDAAQFQEFAWRHQEATLGQMRLSWEHEHGQILSEKTFSTWLFRIGWTRKKRVGFMPSETLKNDASSSSA